MRLLCNTDGAIKGQNPSNTMGAGIIVKEEETGVKHGLMKKTIVHDGNSYISEYLALIHLFEFILNNYDPKDVESITVRCDLEPMIKQLQGEYSFKRRDGTLGKCYVKTLEILTLFDEYGFDMKYIWVPREQNEDADRLSKFALDL